MTLTSHEIEKKMIHSILTGKYPIGSRLQPERELAALFQVGRPMVREVLQRLNYSGWLTLQKNRSAIVNDFWKEGNATTIVDIIRHSDHIPHEYVLYFLEMRISFTPQYVKKSIQLHNLKVVAVLSRMDELEDCPEDYALYDWELQKELASLSENPLFLLTLNSFSPAYVQIATQYFSLSSTRQASRNYYKELLTFALNRDAVHAEALTHSMMEKSYSLWKHYTSKDNKIEEA